MTFHMALVFLYLDAFLLKDKLINNITLEYSFVFFSKPFTFKFMAARIDHYSMTTQSLVHKGMVF